METNNRRKLRIVYLTILLIFTFSMFSTTSYAWFTTNRIITIKTIDVHVAASGGIQISTDGNNWKAIITPDEITEAHSTTYPTSVNQIPASLEPVSSGKQVDTNGFLKLYYGLTNNTMSGEYTLASTRSMEHEGSGAESNGKFIAFDLFFKADNPVDLYLTKESGVTYKDPETSKGIANAFRVAFVNEGNVPDGTNLNTIQALREATDGDAYIWEPNYDTHTVAGVTNARETYEIETTTTNGDRIPYDGIINEFAESDGVTVKTAKSSIYPNLFRRVNVDYYTKNGFTENTQAFSLDRGITKMRIYVWIEGQDVDCENNASYDFISFDLQLSVNPS